MISFTEFEPLDEIIALTDKKVVVTGGARGIGLAISYRLAEAGAIVLIADMDNDGAQAASKAFKKIGYKVIPVQCNVGNEEEVKKMVESAISKMGGIDILVNNAGIYPRMSLTEMTAADFDRVVSVNLKGTVFCSREVSQHMIDRRKGGCIINLASIDAVHPSQKGMAAYDASKGAILTLTKSLALELGQYDIRVNAIAPGGILTEGVLFQDKDSSSVSGKSQLRAFMARMPLGRMGRADDVARVALFLASEMSSYITGTFIVVDGGYLIS